MQPDRKVKFGRTDLNMTALLQKYGLCQFRLRLFHPPSSPVAEVASAVPVCCLIRNWVW